VYSSIAIALNHCNATDRCWNNNEVSLPSQDTLLILWPRAKIKSEDDELNAPKFSTSMHRLIDWLINQWINQSRPRGIWQKFQYKNHWLTHVMVQENRSAIRQYEIRCKWRCMRNVAPRIDYSRKDTKVKTEAVWSNHDILKFGKHRGQTDSIKENINT